MTKQSELGRIKLAPLIRTILIQEKTKMTDKMQEEANHSTSPHFSENWHAPDISLDLIKESLKHIITIAEPLCENSQAYKRWCDDASRELQAINQDVPLSKYSELQNYWQRRFCRVLSIQDPKILRQYADEMEDVFTALVVKVGHTERSWLRDVKRLLDVAETARYLIHGMEDDDEVND